MKNQTIFVTGADGGIGSALVKECVNKGASKVYAAGLNMGILTDMYKEYKDVVYPIQLDITDENQIKKISDDCTDTDILINNAGVERKCNFTSSNSFKESKLSWNS